MLKTKDPNTKYLVHWKHFNTCKCFFVCFLFFLQMCPWKHSFSVNYFYLYFTGTHVKHSSPKPWVNITFINYSDHLRQHQDLTVSWPCVLFSYWSAVLKASEFIPRDHSVYVHHQLHCLCNFHLLICKSPCKHEPYTNTLKISNLQKTLMLLLHLDLHVLHTKCVSKRHQGHCPIFMSSCVLLFSRL